MSTKILTAATAALSLVLAAGASHAANLISDGDFSSPSIYPNWSAFPNGTVGGWVNNTEDALEIGASPIYGLPCISSGCQNLEVNWNNFDTVSQAVTGLTVGKTYNLFWDYGGRNGGGPQSLNVSFGGDLLKNDSSDGLPNDAHWTGDWFEVTATSTTQTLTFQSLATAGDPSYGGEITNVFLTAVPEPATWAMLLLGVGMMGGSVRISRRKDGLGQATA